MWAIDNGNEACQKALIAAGADLNYETKVGAGVECVQESGAPVNCMVGV